MSMSLYESVVNESFGMDFGGEADTRLDPATEAEINDRIDDETSMMQYTGECLVGMMALEAAVAKMDGIMAVKAMQAKASGDTAAFEQLDATMEGFIGNVWETLKEWVNKAYTAIKNFLIKQWNKLKGAANVVKAFFGKYGDVLRSKRVPGCRVKWMSIDVMGAEKVFNKHASQISSVLSDLSVDKALGRKSDEKWENAVNKAKTDSSLNRAERGRRAAQLDQPDTPGAGYAHVSRYIEKIPRPKDIHDDLRKEIYNDVESDHEVEFESIRREAIEAADIGSYKKYIEYFSSMGDKSHQEALKAINQSQRMLAKERETDKSRGVSYIHNAMRQCLHAQVELHRLCMSAMYSAARRKQSYSISACRKAIMYHSTKGAGATETEESWNPSGGLNGITVSDLVDQLI